LQEAAIVQTARGSDEAKEREVMTEPEECRKPKDRTTGVAQEEDPPNSKCKREATRGNIA
jgi:hypothetical protein